MGPISLASIRKIGFHGFRRRENTVLRANLPPKSVYVIPNAIVADHFRPARSTPHTDMSPYSRLCPCPVPADLLTHGGRAVTIIVVSRLAYRKGVDLLVATAPRICAAFPNVRFVVGECIVPSE
jgi:phosphatidylinositol glycan class A protein